MNNNNGNFNNGNFNNGVLTPTQGCGAPSYLPGVAVYTPEVTCPSAGIGANTFTTPVTPIKTSLVPPIPRFGFDASSVARAVILGNITDEDCIALIASEIGVTPVDICDAATTINMAGEVLCCFLHTGNAINAGLIAKSAADLTGLTATQISFDPCSPCFASDTDFICTNGCGNMSNFVLQNVMAGRATAIVINIPAGVALTLDVCSCAPEVPSFAGCPVPVPAVAQIVSGPACPPNGYVAQNNGQIVNRQF